MKSQKILREKPRDGELRTPKLKSHLLRTQSIATYATFTARDFFLAKF